MNGPEKFLLDTNIISETRKRSPNDGVMAFLSTVNPRSLFISVLTLGELRKGIAIKRRTDPPMAKLLEEWVDGLERMFADRILPVDVSIANRWGEISADRSRPVIDTLIAATALRHELAVVTRNVVDFDGLNVEIINPWLAS